MLLLCSTQKTKIGRVTVFDLKKKQGMFMLHCAPVANCYFFLFEFVQIKFSSFRKEDAICFCYYCGAQNA